MCPRLSIITINLNNAEGLRKTIKSVIDQDFSDFEYIVIDGASTDGSVEVIKQYVDKITYWVSEPDSGIYNAMNKGIARATGEYCLFLNSGDWLESNQTVASFIDYKPSDDIIIGNINNIIDNKITLNRTASKEEFGFEHFWVGGFLPHQATFTKRQLFFEYGLYNEDLQIASDLEFLVKALLKGDATYNHIDMVVANYDMTGISSIEENAGIHFREREKIFNTYVPYVYKSFIKMYIKAKDSDRYYAGYEEYRLLKAGKFKILMAVILYIKNRKWKPQKFQS